MEPALLTAALVSIARGHKLVSTVLVLTHATAQIVDPRLVVKWVNACAIPSVLQMRCAGSLMAAVIRVRALVLRAERVSATGKIIRVHALRTAAVNHAEPTMAAVSLVMEVVSPRGMCASTIVAAHRIVRARPAALPMDVAVNATARAVHPIRA